jgi:tRNA uridine 5-carbamoylmethylation protein Kti12|tara:strand:- start:454 stop:642 length:189 start_codon:yes stop_codon:yes gene_type:complete
MKLQQTHINIIKEVINDAHSDAKRTNTEYSVVYVDTLQELITVRSELSGEEFGWQHILSVSP